jgi:peptide/nickel transport system permease protein
MIAVRISLEIAAAAVLIAGTVGVLIGMTAGFFGGWLDDLTMRISDAVLAIPIVLLALSVLAVVGGGIRNLILVIAFTQWMTYARTSRAETLTLRQQDYVRAARAIGARNGRILRRHVLPHLLPSAIALATLNVSVAILLEAGLSYLGLGVQPPDPSLGSMLTDGRQYIFRADWLAIYPGVALLLLVLGINLLGDGISSFLDPRAQRRASELKPL